MEEGPTRTNNKVVFLCYPCSTACTPRLLASVCVPEASFPGRKFGSPQFLTDNRPPTNHTLHYGLISTWIKKCKMSAKANLSVSHQTSNWISDLNFLQFLRFRCPIVCSQCIGLDCIGFTFGYGVKKIFDIPSELLQSSVDSGRNTVN